MTDSKLNAFLYAVVITIEEKLEKSVVLKRTSPELCKWNNFRTLDSVLTL